MSFLRVIGWIFIPYIMIFFQWKRVGKTAKVFGTAWAAIALIIGISGATSGGSDDTTASSSITSQQPSNEVNNTNATQSAKVSDAPKETPKTSPKATPKPSEENKPKLEVLEQKSVSEQYSNYITGTIRNNTKKEYSYVQVEINLYDKDGSQVGSTLANTNNLEAGGTWKFKAYVLEDDVASYKIKDVTGF